ncbi:MAG: tetratricopeptide repeat protein, partial [Candidatus Poribacteria bacterium]
SFTTVGKKMCLDARLVRVETGEVLSAGNNRCDITDENVFETVDKVAKLVTTRMKADYKELVADIYYSKGRTAEENGDKEGAIGFYKQALKLSSSHQLSKKALDKLKAT